MALRFCLYLEHEFAEALLLRRLTPVGTAEGATFTGGARIIDSDPGHGESSHNGMTDRPSTREEGLGISRLESRYRPVATHQNR